MKTIVRDIFILLAICSTAWLLMHIRLHARQTEKMRAQVVYSTDMDRQSAESLMNGLEKVGFLNGVPRPYHIDRLDDVIQLLVVAEPDILSDPQVEGLLRSAFSEVCGLAFPDEQVTVSLTDTNLSPFLQLIEPQQF